MGIPQLILLILLTMSLGMNVATKENPWSPIINYVIIMGLLWWGGFFT